jgi:O-antigen/teichoic acid export membrane protein
VNLARNIGAGWVAAALSAVIGLSVVPFQIHFLGVEAYGLIGFAVTVQSVLLLLDMGMTATINRELARCVAPGMLAQALGLLGAMERICWGIAALCAAGMALLASPIANRWLHLVQLDAAEVTQALVIVGALVALRWPVALYQSALLGMQRMVLASVINTGAVIASAAAGLGALAWVAADIRVFFASQLFVLAIQLLVLRVAASGALSLSWRWPAAFGELPRVWRFTALSGLVTASGVCLMQADKLLLSSMLTLDALGQYSLASLVATGLYVITMPMFNAFYPRFSVLLASGETGQLESLYRLGSGLLAALLAPVGFVFVLYASDLIQAWTGNAALAAQVAPLAGLLVLGSMLHGLMFIPFALTMAHARAGLALKINLCLLVLLVPLVLLGTLQWGAQGAAGAWLLLQASYLLGGSYVTHRVLLPSARATWLSHDIVPPLASAALVAVLVERLGAFLGGGIGTSLAMAFIAWVLAAAAALGSTPMLRRQSATQWARIRRRSCA